MSRDVWDVGRLRHERGEDGLLGAETPPGAEAVPAESGQGVSVSQGTRGCKGAPGKGAQTQG